MIIKNNSIYNVDSYKAIKDIPDNSVVEKIRELSQEIKGLNY